MDFSDAPAAIRARAPRESASSTQVGGMVAQEKHRGAATDVGKVEGCAVASDAGPRPPLAMMDDRHRQHMLSPPPSCRDACRDPRPRDRTGTVSSKAPAARMRSARNAMFVPTVFGALPGAVRAEDAVTPVGWHRRCVRKNGFRRPTGARFRSAPGPAPVAASHGTPLRESTGERGEPHRLGHGIVIDEGDECRRRPPAKAPRSAQRRGSCSSNATTCPRSCHRLAARPATVRDHNSPRQGARPPARAHRGKRRTFARRPLARDDER